MAFGGARGAQHRWCSWSNIGAKHGACRRSTCLQCERPGPAAYQGSLYDCAARPDAEPIDAPDHPSEGSFRKVTTFHINVQNSEVQRSATLEPRWRVGAANRTWWTANRPASFVTSGSLLKNKYALDAWSP